MPVLKITLQSNVSACSHTAVCVCVLGFWQRLRPYLLKALSALFSLKPRGCNEAYKEKKMAAFYKKKEGHGGGCSLVLKMTSMNKIKHDRRSRSENKRWTLPSTRVLLNAAFNIWWWSNHSQGHTEPKAIAPLPLVWGELNKKYLSREKQREKPNIL